MTHLVILVALSSVLVFEGARVLLMDRRSKTGALLLALGLASIGAAHYLNTAVHSSAERLAASLTPLHTAPPWSDPRSALPHLSPTDRAEKTRIVASGYFHDTGVLIDHLSPQSEAVRFTPNQEELALREKSLVMRASFQMDVARTQPNLALLLFVPIIAGIGAYAATKASGKRDA